MAANTVTFMKARSEGGASGPAKAASARTPGSARGGRSLDQEDVLAVLDKLSVADLEQLDREAAAALAHEAGASLRRRRPGGEPTQPVSGSGNDDEESSTEGEDDYGEDHPQLPGSDIN